MPCLASPVWVGWATIHTKTLLDVYLLSSNLAVRIHKRRYGNGNVHIGDDDSLTALLAWSFCISSLTWAGCVAYPLSRQRRPDDGVSKGKTPTSFFCVNTPEGVLDSAKISIGKDLY